MQPTASPKLDIQTCPSLDKMVLTSFSTKMFISASLPLFKHSVLQGATHNTKIPHKAPYSIPTTPQCSFSKSGQMDGHSNDRGVQKYLTFFVVGYKKECSSE